MKVFKTILVVLLIVLIIIQFFHPAKNISTAHSPNDIAVVYNEPDNVRTILNKACNDCHSNNTRYPWYNNIQPVAWWLNDHVQEGKHELNFNEFGTYPIRRQYHIHTGARLTDEEKATLTNWANSIRATIKAKYPADSLIRKR